MAPRREGSGMLDGLLPHGVTSRELRRQGCEADLLGAERLDIARAVESRRREFAAGRHCARHALAQLGFAERPLRAGHDRRPCWPDGSVGSITHAAAYAAAVAGRRGAFAGLGIDAESSDRVEPELWPEICRPEELAYLRGLPAARQRIAATLFFSAKESLYKAQYEITRAWLGFLDATVDIGESSFVIDVPALRSVASDGRFSGRYRVDGGLIVTAVAIWASAVSEFEPAPRAPDG